MKAQLAYSQSEDDDGEFEHRLEVSVELRTLGRVDGGFGF
jgi:hypothetical protein